MKKLAVEKIENVFLQLIQEKDVKDITVSEICKKASVNRTTFYVNYLDIYDLVEKIRIRMINEFADIFKDTRNEGHSRENYLLMFRHIKDNQTFYQTYFKLGFDVNYEFSSFDKELAYKKFNNKLILYHMEFFAAGMTAIIKRWLKGGCKESPEDIVTVIEEEYNGLL